MAGINGSNVLVQKLWNYCNILRDDGLSYGDYLEQLTFLLFLKMADEQSRPPYNKPSAVPAGFGWDVLVKLSGDDLETHYRHTLEELGRRSGMLGLIFRKAQNKIQDPAKLQRLIVDLIDREQWSSLSADVKGDAYEGLLQKNAEDVKGGAGQYFTPRALISAMVECVAPRPGETICDPACGTGGFLLAAYDYLVHNNDLDRDELRALQSGALHGVELVDGVTRLCAMNLLLHGIGSESGSESGSGVPPLEDSRRQDAAATDAQRQDAAATDAQRQDAAATDAQRQDAAATDAQRRGAAVTLPVSTKDALAAKHGEYEVVLTNPPFGKKSSVTIVGEDGDTQKESLVITREDFWATTSNKQLNFLQHVWTILVQHGRAAIVVPDNVLFEGGAGETVRRRLLDQADVHTLLRLPTGIFYAQGVKANVLFFDRKPAREQPWTERLWIYDFRTNQHFTLKTNPLKRSDLDGFVACYSPANRHERQETERFRSFTYDELTKRDKANLDIFWLKDESLEDSANLPEPDVIAREIIEDLQAALEQFALIADDAGAVGAEV